MASNGVSNGATPTAKSQFQTGLVPLFLNGKDVTTETTFTVRNPATGKDLWQSSSCSATDAVKAVEAAQAAYPAWSKTKPSVRRDILLKAGDLFASRKDELAHYMKEETGAVDQFVDFIITITVDQLKDVAGRISAIQGFVPTVAEEGTSAIVYKEPYGVVLGIAPWNAPYALGVRTVSYALAAGNTTVLKGPELSPRTYWAIADIFREAGLPAGCLNLIYHRPQDAAEVTNTLIAHPAVKKINFTGSTNVGSIVASLAGKYLKPVLMELGGKASAIVLKDADLQKAALGCTLGAFLHSGQICMSTERILVHSSIAEPFAQALKETTNAIFGPNSPSPVLVSSAGVTKNKSLLTNALSKGANVVLGDPNSTEDLDTKMRPVILSKITKDMDLYYTESFGPTVSLYTFDTEEEALALANDTEYGLAGAVFTEDLAAGLRVAKAYETGAVHINSMTVHDESALPHGGMKKSGFGRFNGAQGLEEFVRCKTVTWKD